MPGSIGPQNLDGEAPQQVSLRMVAERAGVAMSSASRVLSNHPDVSPRMRRRVLAAVEEMGYEPNLLAQSLRRGETLCVGFVMRDISSPLFAEIVLGAEIALQSAGYSLLLSNSEGLPELDAQCIRLLRRRRVDGMLLSFADEGNAETLEELRLLRQPTVLIDRDLPAEFGASAVLSDHAAGLRAAVEHLVGLGHRRIGLASGPLELRPGRECAAAVREACAALGVSAVVECGQFLADHGYQAAFRMLDLPDPPTAVISGSNQILPGMLRALIERGLRVGDDISLVTFDDLPMLEFVQPPIAVVARDPRVIGRTAAELLLARLRGGRPEQVQVPTRFEPRASCAAPRVVR